VPAALSQISLLDSLLQAAQPLLGTAFELWGGPVTWLEIVACVLSLAMVWANMRVNMLGWPLAIASSLLYGLLFANSKLYGEASLQLVFVVLALWGWWSWWQGRTHAQTGQAGQVPLQVRWMSARQRVMAGALTLACWPLLGLWLQRATDSDVPFFDALPTVASVCGQILLGRKFIDNWPVWLAVNVVSVGLFAYKGLWLTAMLYGVFALLSCWGWRAWQMRAARERLAV
jgi:nicotinamide mononucleotide transporter